MADEPNDYLMNQALHHLTHGGQVAGDHGPDRDPTVHGHPMQVVDLGEFQRQVEAQHKAMRRQARINFLVNAGVIWTGNFVAMTAALWIWSHWLR